MKLVVQVAAGIVLAVVLLLAGCTFLIVHAGTSGDPVLTVPHEQP